ncbi:MAG: biotin/lipoyl-binding protein [Acidiferrobacterales bacterium]|nr:biotin/lipoyl-binding protein [Acidiferrobacterales bacterium]
MYKALAFHHLYFQAGQPSTLPQFLKRFVKFLIPVVIIAAGVVGFGLLKVEEVQEQPEVQEERAWLVDTQAIEKQTINPSVRLYGRVVTPTFSTLSAIVDGEIIQVNVKSGQSVEAGDVLIRLDSRNLETQLRQAEAELRRVQASIARESQRLVTDQEILEHEKRLLQLANESLERARTLKSRNLIAQADFDSFERAEQQAHLAVTAREAAIREYDSRVAVIEADVERIQASLDKTRLDIEDTVISAPYTGRVTEVLVGVGNQVRNGTQLLSMYDHNNLEVLSMIPNRYVSEIRNSVADGYHPQAAAELDDHVLKLTFDRLGSIVDRGRGGVDAYFGLVTNPLQPELSRSIQLVLTLSPVADAFAIPYRAVFGLDRVYKIEAGALKSVTIKRHGQVFRNGTSLVVATSDGLTDGDVLVTTQLTNAIDGLKVKPYDGG